MDILTILFFVGSLLLSLVFLYTAVDHLRAAQAGQRIGEVEAAEYLKRRAILGGALAVNRLFWMFIILLPYLPWIDGTAAFLRDALFAVWLLNEAISWWAWRKTV